MLERFDDRSEGGRALAAKLSEYKNRKDVVVLALPRGGVPVGFEIAKAINVPLDVFIVRKLGVPEEEEVAFGAIAEGGITVFNEAYLHDLNLPISLIEKIIERERNEIERREKLYRMNRQTLDLEGKTVIIADDGLATGATMRAAIAAIRSRNPKQIIVAAPIASRDVCEGIMQKSDDLCICAIMPEPFFGVGMWYRNFDQTTDAEVIDLLNRAEKAKSAGE